MKAPFTISLDADQLAKAHAIFGTDLSKPLSDSIEDIRSQLSRTRGQISDLMRAFPGWSDRLDHVEGLLTCGICALAHSAEQVTECEVTIADRENGPSLFFRPRGIGSECLDTCFVTGQPLTSMVPPNLAAFVHSKEEGETIVGWFGGHARLDYRPSEPNWVQVKVGVVPEHLPNLQRLLELTARHGRIRQHDIELAKAVLPASPSLS